MTKDAGNPSPRIFSRASHFGQPARILLLLVALAIAMAVPGRPPAASAQGQTRLVLAFYYAWYGPGSFGPGKTPFQPPQPYASSDGSVIQRHVSQAKSAGIDAFVQSWYGPAPNQTESNFQTLLNVASASGFKAAIDFETGSPYFASNDDRIAALKTLISTHANHPAYLRVDGKPIIFFWANWVLGVDEWSQIRDQVDPGRSTIWIAEGSNLDYLSVFDGMHLYNTAWSANPAGTAITWADRTRSAAQNYGFRYWVATAMPGFDDSLLGRGDATIVQDRGGGVYYQSSFSGAAASAPDMLLINSFNEWAEGSNIEPSVEFGNLYLELTSEMSAAFKSGAVPPVSLPPQPAQAGPTTAPSLTPTYGPSPTPSATATATYTPTPVASPTAQSDGLIVYVVQPGDSFIHISDMFDVPLEELYALNGLEEGSLLAIGQRLIIGKAGQLGGRNAGPDYPGALILPNGNIVYQLREGDSLYGIAQRYGLTLDELLELNAGLDETSILQIGQQIVVGFRPLPAEVGGSTDQPILTDTPSPTLELTATASATTAPTATATSPPQATPTTAEPMLQSEPSSGGGIDGFVLILVAVVAVLAGLGGLFLYLGRPR
jgi:LysM repeat protein